MVIPFLPKSSIFSLNERRSKPFFSSPSLNSDIPSLFPHPLPHPLPHLKNSKNRNSCFCVEIMNVAISSWPENFFFIYVRTNRQLSVIKQSPDYQGCRINSHSILRRWKTSHSHDLAVLLHSEICAPWWLDQAMFTSKTWMSRKNGIIFTEPKRRSHG